MATKQVKKATCPRCGTEEALEPSRALNALSRKDNKTYVCSSCGTDEAMIQFTAPGLDIWPNYPNQIGDAR